MIALDLWYHFFSYHFSYWNFFFLCLPALLPVFKAFLCASWLMRLRYSSLYLSVASLAPKSPSLAACATSLCPASWPLLLLCPLGAGDWTQCFCACRASVLLLSWTCPQPHHDLLWLFLLLWLEFLCNLHLLNSIFVWRMAHVSLYSIMTVLCIQTGTCKYLWPETKCLRI